MAHPRAANQEEDAEEEEEKQKNKKKNRRRRTTLLCIWLNPGANQALSGLPGFSNEDHSFGTNYHHPPPPRHFHPT